MAYTNPHLHLHWREIGARLLLDDIEEFVDRIRIHYPTMVLFARSLHLGYRPNRQQYTEVPIKFWQGPRDYLEQPNLQGNLPSGGLALRVPWPPETEGNDPEQLIGGRNRNPYEDDRARYRRFGRTIYLDAGISDEIAHANKSVISEITGAPIESIPDIRFLKHHDARSGIELLYDAEDPDITSFVAVVRSCLRNLASATGGSYDVLSGEPIFTFGMLPESKRWLRRCALENHLYTGPGSQMGSRVLFTGPAPRMLKKWRLEANQLYGRSTDPKAVKKLDRAAFCKMHHAGLSQRLPDEIEDSPG